MESVAYAEEVINWMHNVMDKSFVDEERIDWFLLPYSIVEELAKTESFDPEFNAEIAGGLGYAGVLRTIPIKIGFKLGPCYLENYKVFWFHRTKVGDK